MKEISKAFANKSSNLFPILTYRSLAKIFSEGERSLIVPIILLQNLIFLSICSWKLRCFSKITSKCFLFFYSHSLTELLLSFVGI